MVAPILKCPLRPGFCSCDPAGHQRSQKATHQPPDSFREGAPRNFVLVGYSLRGCEAFSGISNWSRAFPLWAKAQTNLRPIRNNVASNFFMLTNPTVQPGQTDRPVQAARV